MATSIIKPVVPLTQPVDITAQCSSPSGTIQRVIYTVIGRIVCIEVQINSIPFTTGTNIWVQLPDSFPANEGIYCPLSTAYDGMLCVYRNQSGVQGKFLLLQCSVSGTYNLTAAGICFI